MYDTITKGLGYKSMTEGIGGSETTQICVTSLMKGPQALVSMFSLLSEFLIGTAPIKTKLDVVYFDLLFGCVKYPKAG